MNATLLPTTPPAFDDLRARLVLLGIAARLHDNGQQAPDMVSNAAHHTLNPRRRKVIWGCYLGARAVLALPSNGEDVTAHAEAALVEATCRLLFGDVNYEHAADRSLDLTALAS